MLKSLSGTLDRSQSENLELFAYCKVISTMEAFSTAANAFSVIGLADVVFRLGVDTASLYSRYRNASKDIASLVDEIQAFVEIIAQIRVYLDEYRQSPYAQSDGQSLLPQLSKILSDCEKELRYIQQLANKHKREPNDGLAMQMMKSWRWTLQNDVSKSGKRIRHLNMNLQNIFLLIGGYVIPSSLYSARISTSGGLHDGKFNTFLRRIGQRSARYNLKKNTC